MNSGADVNGLAVDNTNDGGKAKEDIYAGQEMVGGQGRTPLHICGMFMAGRSLEPLFTLLREGADPTLRDASRHHFTPAELSEHMGTPAGYALWLWGRKYACEELNPPFSSVLASQKQKGMLLPTYKVPAAGAANKKKGAAASHQPVHQPSLVLSSGNMFDDKCLWVTRRVLLRAGVDIKALQLTSMEASLIQRQMREEAGCSASASAEPSLEVDASFKAHLLDAYHRTNRARRWQIVHNLQREANLRRGRAEDGHHSYRNKQMSRVACGCKNCRIDFDAQFSSDIDFERDYGFFGNYQEADFETAMASLTRPRGLARGRAPYGGYGGGGGGRMEQIIEMLSGRMMFGDAAYDDEGSDEDYGDYDDDDDYGGGYGGGGHDDMMEYLMRRHPAYFMMEDEDDQERYWKHNMYFDV